MAVVVAVAHLCFAFYFFVRLVSANPFLPTRITELTLPIFRLLFLALTPLLPLLLSFPSLPLLLPISYALATLAALRFAADAPLLSFAHFSLRHYPRLLLWRLDVLIYFLFVCSIGLTLPFLIIPYSLLALVAVVTNATDLYARARQHQQNPSLRYLLSLAITPASPSRESIPVPPNVRNASAFTLLSFEWVTPIVATGRARSLESHDVTPLSEDFTCHTSGHIRFQPIWQQEMSRAHPNQPSLFRALFRAFGRRLIIGGSLKLINDICIFISPMLLRLVILHLQNRVGGDESSLRGLMLAFALFSTYICQSMVFNQYFNIICTVQVLLRGALIDTVFQKSTCLSPESRGLYTSGQIQNLMSTDTRTVSDVVLYIHMLWSSLEQICVALFLLVQLMGWMPTTAGVLFIISCMPLQTFLVSRIKRLREKASSRTDDRVKFVAEAIKGIKLVKLYAWEISFVKRILEARAKELDFLRRMAFLQAWNSVLVTSLPTILTIIAFATYAATGRKLDAAVVFPAIALFNVIRPPLLFFPNTLINAARAAASLSRLSKFLNAKELKPLSEGHYAVDQTWMELNKIDLAASDASFTWDPSITMTNPTLSSVSFQIPEGSLVAVVGPTGGGKSTLLAGLLGELPIVSGKAGIRSNRTVSFCDQVPFIQNATVRENILFGKPFDETHYKNTVRVCSLESDFDILPAGDLTEIGGRGVNLSGGQRARVSLARAVYSNADVCLLDDPLCAVDAHVGKSIFNNCIVSKLRGKTRVLTTNLIHFAASREVDYIIVVKNGTVFEAGSRNALLADPESDFSQLLKDSGELEEDEPLRADVQEAAAISTDPVEDPSQDSEIEPLVSDRTKLLKLENGSKETQDQPKAQQNYGTIGVGRLTKDETKVKGRVQVKYYHKYLSAMGLRQWVLPIFVFAVSSQFASLGVNVWLSIWSERNSTDDTLKNLLVFFLLGLSSVVVTGGSAFSLACGAIQASVIIHEKLLLSVFGAPSSFFNSTPEGRLVNRFNSDLDKVDSSIAPTMQSLMRLVLSLMFTLGLILWATPAFIFVVAPVGAICVYIQEFYRKSSVDLRRLEALARSPLYSHFSETLDGVVTIRAYKDVERASHINEGYADQLNRTSYATSYANRWIAVRLELLGTILIFGSTTLAVLTPPGRLSASIIGLVLSYTMQILGAMTWSVRQFTESESQLSSIERISEYSNSPFPQEEEGGIQGFLEEEKESSNALTHSESMGLISDETLVQLNHGVSQRRSRWPKKGKIKFENVEMRYRQDLEPALKRVSFSIQPGEHVGIVGRTGAGKSSAIQSLFRLYELNNGRILIDDVDISSLRLFFLRSSLGVIPQEPVCFSGDIRSNLDMFGEHDDAAVKKALDSCGLQETMRQKVSLDFAVAENGSNLSVGQRQLLCLGRALLKDSQILILDEATSSVSTATDETIQKTLRDEMHHCTILTVAHRLQTVMQSDRIIVMERGKIAEMGRPDDLLKIPSRLSALVDETGPATAAHLRHLASLPRAPALNGHDRNFSGNGTTTKRPGLNCCIGRVPDDSLVEKVCSSFTELRSALTSIESPTWQEELQLNNIDESRWRERLYTMVSRLSTLAGNVPADMQARDAVNYAIEVPDQSADILGEALEDAALRMEMPRRDQTSSRVTFQKGAGSFDRV